MTTLFFLVLAFLAGALTSYLVLRNNPDVRTKADELTDKVEKRLDDKDDGA